MDEERRACEALSDLLATALLRAHDNGRFTLFCWERAGLAWIIRLMDRRADGYYGSAWTFGFIETNREAILNPSLAIDWNLRAARLKREGAANAAQQ